MSRSKKAILLTLLLAIPMLIALIGSPTAQGQESKEGSKIIEHAASDADKAATESLWTREARESAQPLPWVDDGGYDTADDSDPSLNEPRGAVPGILPDPNADAQAQKEFPNEWNTPEILPPLDEKSPSGTDGTAGVFTPYPANYFSQMWKVYPWRATGKFYFTNSSGGGSYCTASLIGTRTLVTAAHCVYTRGAGWHSNMSFVPAERYGVAPYGSFSWSNAWILNGWISDGGRRWDVAVVRLNPNSSGYNASYYTGYLGRSWNFNFVQSLHAFGYASNISTQYTSACAAESYYGGSADVIDMGCDMTYGSSGGPWIKNYRPFTSGAFNYVNAVVSGPGTAFGTTIRGPRFSTSNIVPLCDAAAC